MEPAKCNGGDVHFFDGDDTNTPGCGLYRDVSKTFVPVRSKVRKPRTTFSAAALRAFKLIFERDAYPGWDVISALSKKYDIPDGDRYTIQTWFANRRNRTRNGGSCQKVDLRDLDQLISSNGENSDHDIGETLASSGAGKMQTLHAKRSTSSLRRAVHSRESQSTSILAGPFNSHVISTGRSVDEFERQFFVDPSRSVPPSMSTSWPWWMSSQPTASAQLQQPQSAAPHWYCPMRSSNAVDNERPSQLHRSNPSDLLARHVAGEALLPVIYASYHRGSTAPIIKCESTVSGYSKSSPSNDFRCRSSTTGDVRSTVLPTGDDQRIRPPFWSTLTSSRLASNSFVVSSSTESRRSPRRLLPSYAQSTGSGRSSPIVPMTSRHGTSYSCSSLYPILISSGESTSSVLSERPLDLSGGGDVGYDQDSRSPPLKCWRPGHDTISY